MSAKCQPCKQDFLRITISGLLFCLAGKNSLSPNIYPARWKKWKAALPSCHTLGSTYLECGQSFGEWSPHGTEELTCNLPSSVSRKGRLYLLFLSANAHNQTEIWGSSLTLFPLVFITNSRVHLILLAKHFLNPVTSPHSHCNFPISGYHHIYPARIITTTFWLISQPWTCLLLIHSPPTAIFQINKFD